MVVGFDEQVTNSINQTFSQIKFVYDDETTWCYGWSDGGKEDNRPLILVKGTVYNLDSELLKVN